MFKSSKKNDVQTSNLIRLHPKKGGVDIIFGGQSFHGVSTDVFLGLDQNDLSQTYQKTRKFNLSLAVNPNLWRVEQFLSYLTSGNLESTSKCMFHGDRETGLNASHNLMNLLPLHRFHIDGVCYVYDSIGVACNWGYAPVSQRQGNNFENTSSHFEIKFRAENEPNTYLCLNIHVMPERTRKYGQREALERLEQAIRLFYAELGLLNTGAYPYKSCTHLKTALKVTADNYDKQGFSCKHGRSLDALDNYAVAQEYRPHRGTFLFGNCIEKALKETKPSVCLMVESSPQADEKPPSTNAWSKKLTF